MTRMISSTYVFIVLSKRVLTILYRPRYHPGHRLPYSTMTRLVVTAFPLLMLTIPEPPSPGSSIHAPEGEILPSGSSRDVPQLSIVEPVSPPQPPQDAVTEEHPDRIETSRGLLGWLPMIKRSKGPAVDKPDQLSRGSHHSNPQSRSQSSRVSAGPPRMAEDRRQRVSVPGPPRVYLTRLTRYPRERSMDRPRNTWFVVPRVSSPSLSFITHHRINHLQFVILPRPKAPPTKDEVLQNYSKGGPYVHFYWH